MGAISIGVELDKGFPHPEHLMKLSDKRGLSDECNMIRVFKVLYHPCAEGKGCIRDREVLLFTTVPISLFPHG
jgi:hypothetical protein